jgi:hypothetical protein
MFVADLLNIEEIPLEIEDSLRVFDMALADLRFEIKRSLYPTHEKKILQDKIAGILALHVAALLDPQIDQAAAALPIEKRGRFGEMLGGYDWSGLLEIYRPPVFEAGEEIEAGGAVAITH